MTQQQKYIPAPVDISAITDSVLDITQELLKNRSLKLRVECKMSEHLFVLADTFILHEVLINLLSNSVKFTEDGGCIRFAVEQCGKDDRRTRIRYCISDSGIGMSQEYLAHIFDEFSQENVDVGACYKGSSHGMAVTKQYVDIMGGSISVSSKQNLGTVCIVELPFELAS